MRAVAIEMHEVRARIRQAPLFHDRRIDVDAPVIFMVHVIARAGEKRADIAAEVEDLAAFPDRMTEQFVEVGKLRQPRRDEVPGNERPFANRRFAPSTSRLSSCSDMRFASPSNFDGPSYFDGPRHRLAR